MKKVTDNSKAPRSGQIIICPICETETKVKNFAWIEKECTECKITTQKRGWYIAENPVTPEEIKVIRLINPEYITTEKPVKETLIKRIFTFLKNAI